MKKIFLTLIFLYGVNLAYTKECVSKRVAKTGSPNIQNNIQLKLISQAIN